MRQECALKTRKMIIRSAGKTKWWSHGGGNFTALRRNHANHVMCFCTSSYSSFDGSIVVPKHLLFRKVFVFFVGLDISICNCSARKILVETFTKPNSKLITQAAGGGGGSFKECHSPTYLRHLTVMRKSSLKLICKPNKPRGLIKRLMK